MATVKRIKNSSVPGTTSQL